MNYIKHYDILIARAIARKLSGYYEVHHIIPRCMGGTNNANNLVELTPAEHFIAHLLLCRIYPSVDGLVTAAFLMSHKGKYTNKVYGKLREQYAQIRSHNMIGERNHMYGKTHDIAARNKVSQANTGRIRSSSHRQAIANAQTGKVMSASTRKLISDANVGRIVTDTTKDKLSKALQGKIRNPDSIAKQSITNTGSGNPNFGNGQAVTGAKNGMYGKKWYVNAKGERRVMFPNDERLQQDDWQNGKEWK
jgi:hypothetical protein